MSSASVDAAAASAARFDAPRREQLVGFDIARDVAERQVVHRIAPSAMHASSSAIARGERVGVDDRERGGAVEVRAGGRSGRPRSSPGSASAAPICVGVERRDDDVVERVAVRRSDRRDIAHGHDPFHPHGRTPIERSAIAIERSIASRLPCSARGVDRAGEHQT